MRQALSDHLGAAQAEFQNGANALAAGNESKKVPKPKKAPKVQKPCIPWIWYFFKCPCYSIALSKVTGRHWPQRSKKRRNSTRTWPSDHLKPFQVYNSSPISPWPVVIAWSLQGSRPWSTKPCQRPRIWPGQVWTTRRRDISVQSETKWFEALQVAYQNCDELSTYQILGKYWSQKCMLNCCLLIRQPRSHWRQPIARWTSWSASLWLSQWLLSWTTSNAHST